MKSTSSNRAQKIQPGTIFAARLRVSPKLSNGDVIVAQVEKDHGDRVELVDLLTGRAREKKKSDLLRRAHIVNKAAAAAIVREFNRRGRHAARELAVSLRAESTSGKVAA
jgi:hypothetical protein